MSQANFDKWKDEFIHYVEQVLSQVNVTGELVRETTVQREFVDGVGVSRKENNSLINIMIHTHQEVTERHLLLALVSNVTTLFRQVS